MTQQMSDALQFTINFTRASDGRIKAKSPDVPGLFLPLRFRRSLPRPIDKRSGPVAREPRNRSRQLHQRQHPLAPIS